MLDQVTEELHTPAHAALEERDAQGRISQRPFGGHSYPRATLAADKTGFFEMQTLYDQLLRYQCFKRYDELFITDIIVEDGRFVALVGIFQISTFIDLSDKLFKGTATVGMLSLTVSSFSAAASSLLS